MAPRALVLPRRAVRGALAATLTLAIVALFAVQAREATTRADRRVGIQIAQSEAGLRVTDVEEGFPAGHAGLAADDEILSIDGHPLTKPIDYDVAAEGFERGHPASYEILRDGEVRSISVVPGVPFPVFQFAFGTLALFGYLALALVVLFQAPGRDLRALLLFLFSTAAAIELALPYQAIGNPALIVLSLSAFYLLTGVQMGTELHLASVIPRRYDWLARRRWIVPAFYVLGSGLGVLTAITYAAEDAAGLDWLPWTMPQMELLLLEIGMPLWALGVPAILIVQVLRAEETRGRHQAALVLAGVLPWSIYVLALSAFELAGRSLPEAFAGLENLALLCYPLAVFVAIFRYQLLDIELVVRRGLVYTLLTGMLILGFYAALGAGSAIFSRWVEGGGEQSVWFISAVTLALGLLFAPLRRMLHRLIDQRFFPERQALRQRLVDLASELPGKGKLPLMGEHLVDRLEAIFAVRSASLLLVDPQSGLLLPLASTGAAAEAGSPGSPLVHRDDAGVEALRRAGRPMTLESLHTPGGALRARLEQLGAVVTVPLIVQEEIIGLLAMGGKQTGERFPAEELELVNLVAHHIATVFQNARLFESATYESLTGLLRREAILEILGQELERAQRYGRPLTVGMADLDHFKTINDRFGHLAGDSMLKMVADGLRQGLRSTDSLGRYGGEEFLFVLPETDLAGGRAVADKLRRLVEGVRVPMETGEEAAITISIGLTSLAEAEIPQHPTAWDLLELADQALYRAKEAGRNRIHPPVISRVG